MTPVDLRMKVRQQAGMTLVELVIVMVVAGILVSIAVPSYQRTVQKTRRADAHASLGIMAQRLERCRTQFGRFNHASCDIASPQASQDGHYSLTLERNVSTYTVTATPVGGQAGDKHCTTLVLDHLGQQTATGSDKDSCW